jgi:alpha-beta hydrolase superfamily lysophospholipase
MSVTGYVALVVLVIGSVLLFTVGVSWIFARFFCKPNRVKYDKSPADYGLQFDPVIFSSNGKHLRGWFVPGNITVPSPAIVLVHSWGGNAAKMLPVAQKLHNSGLSVLLYDARGHGNSDSDGPITLQKITQDLRAAIDYLVTRKDINTTQIGVVGHSMGGAASIVGTSMDSRIKAVVSSSSFADPVELTKGYLKKLHLPLWPYLPLSRRFLENWLGCSMDDVAPYKHIARVKVPILLFHGALDKSVSPENMEILRNNTPGELTESHLLADCEHSGLYNDTEYSSLMLQFVTGNLLKIDAPVV